MLTSVQRNKIYNLKQAQFALEKAIRDIKTALGDSDVTDGYVKDLEGMLVELEMDMEDVQVNG